MTTEQNKKQNKLFDTGTAHIPLKIRDKAIVLSSADVWSGSTIGIDGLQKIPTIFLGIVNEAYPEAIWEDNLKRFKQLFHLEDNYCGQIKICPLPSDKEKIDFYKLSTDVSRAIDILNKTPNLYGMRFVRIGVGHSPLMNDAAESLLKGWNVPFERKIMQFVSLGDSENNHWLTFAHSLCLRQICYTVQFYNTMDYNVHGFLDVESKSLRMIAKHMLDS